MSEQPTKPWLARRYDEDDDAWGDNDDGWHPCTNEQRERWLAAGEPFEFKLATTKEAEG